MWIGLADLPMMPQHRAKCLKMAGVNIKGRAMIYGGVGVDTVYPDSIYIGKGVPLIILRISSSVASAWTVTVIPSKCFKITG